MKADFSVGKLNISLYSECEKHKLNNKPAVDVQPVLLFLRLWPAFWPLHSCGSVQTAVFYCGLSGFTVAEMCDRRLQILLRSVLRAMQGAFPVSEFSGRFVSPLPCPGIV